MPNLHPEVLISQIDSGLLLRGDWSREEDGKQRLCDLALQHVTADRWGVRKACEWVKAALRSGEAAAEAAGAAGAASAAADAARAAAQAAAWDAAWDAEATAWDDIADWLLTQIETIREHHD